MNLFSDLESNKNEVKKEGKNLQIFCDGGSRGNPGNAGAGFVILGKDGRELARGGANLGVQTNNFAEYQSLILALQKSVEIGGQNLEIQMDSKLVIEQMAGNWKVKNVQLKPLFERAKFLIEKNFLSTKFIHIPREKNRVADQIANEFMDRKKV